MRSAIGGILNYSAISQVHRPRDEAAMARAVRDLAAQGCHGAGHRAGAGARSDGRATPDRRTAAEAGYVKVRA